MALIEHLEKLRHFYRLTSYRSIKSGAQGMGISQAGLSKSLANLESVLDVQLFTRTSDGLILTKEGEIVLRATKNILDEAESVETTLRSLVAANIPSKFKIGMYDSIAIYFFPKLSTYLKEIYPSVDLELIVDRSSNLQTLIRNHELDMAIGVNFKETSDNKFFRIFEDHYSAYCSPKILGSATKAPIIYHPEASDGEGTTISNYLEKSLESRVSHKVYNIETVKELTVLGLGVGILPTEVAKSLQEQKLLTQTKIGKVQSIFGKHTIGFLTTKEVTNKHQEFFEDIFRLGARLSKN